MIDRAILGLVILSALTIMVIPAEYAIYPGTSIVILEIIYIFRSKAG